MEVHHHPHIEKKNFKEYFLEFIMIFLAVTLGFFAENYREYLSDNSKEREYIKSYYEDVKKDTASFSITINWFEKAILYQDTLIEYFDDLRKKHFPVVFMRNIRSIRYYEDFVYTDGTIQQLKNAGGFRLIEDVATVDSIMDYDRDIKLQMIQLGTIDAGIMRLIDITDETINNKLASKLVQEHSYHISDFPKGNWLLTTNESTLSAFYNKIGTYEAFCQVYLARLKASKERGVRLLLFLKNEYHLKD